ncbi:MAG: FimV/HubP family polar landmark protein [Betaproteobacteria bacterium]
MNRPPKTKLAVALGGVLLALSTMSASAAGLGKLSVSSALGQPLTAEIELVSLQPGEFESIAARVASPDSYNDAKIEYSPLLRQLRFAVERRSDGRAILKITSSAPINEPFLDVLVEMNWPAGRLLREYPLLLDPPGFSEARISPPVVAAVTPVRPNAPVLVPVAPPTAPVAAQPSSTSPAAGTAAVTPAPASSGTPSSQTESGSDTYGPVKRGDTLNKIAQEMKTDTVSLEQMLVALYRENKAAFIDNNMNRLRTGQILKVPSASEVSKIAEKEARSEIKVQVASWQAYREQVAGNVSASAPTAAAPSNQATGKISVAKPDTPAPAVAPKDQLKIAKTDGVAGKAGTPGASGVNLQDQVNALKEEKIARENSLKEANSRVADLEKQISDMRKLMEMKGLAGKGTQEPAKVAQVTPTPTPPPVKTPEPVKLPEPVKTPDVKTADVKPADTKPADTKPADTKPADTKVEPPKVVDAKPADPKPAPKTPVKAAPPPPPQESFLEENMVAIGAGGVAVLGMVGLFAFMSRRKKKPGSSNTSMSKASSIMPSDLKPNTVTGNRGGGLVDTGNSSFLTDFDKTGPGSIDTDEVDPVAEAEVYIAYGRDAQAEEILKEAMSRDKSRHEITVKLLEIYHARKSVQSFETVARELKETIGGDNPMWAKVAAMGSSIDPQNPLYSGSGQAYETTGAFAAGGASVMAAAAAGEKAPPDVDFDLGFTSSGSTTPTPISAFDVTSPNSDQPAGGMDFDLDLNSGGAASAATAPAGGGLDFDLALDSPAPSAAAAAAEPSGFDFDLSNLSMDSDSTKPVGGTDFTKTIATHATTTTTSVEKSGLPSLADLSLDLDVPGDGVSGGEGPSAVSTKLELAKAYIEIGDSEGAKEILTEVSREGSAAQQAEAKKILAGM